MEHEIPTCSFPTTSTVSLQYDGLLPYFLLQQIGESLNLDDRLNFMASSPHVFKALKPMFRKFTYMQICDEHRENYVKIERTGEEFHFSGRYLVQILQVCPNIQQVLIVVKPPLSPVPENATNCPVFDSTLYHSNGYIGRFCQVAPSSLLQSLKTISLNVDLTIGSFYQLQIPCPVEDLFFAATHLANCSFNTFIQIGFCASTYNVNDVSINRVYLSTMHQICDRMKAMGCKAMIDIGASDGYVDLTVEIKKLEYSFAYFYYNPSICEAHDQNDLNFEPDDEAFSDFNDLVLAETLQQPQLFNKPVEFVNVKYKCNVKDLNKTL